MQPGIYVPVSIWRSSPDVIGIRVVGAHCHTNYDKIKLLENQSIYLASGFKISPKIRYLRLNNQNDITDKYLNKCSPPILTIVQPCEFPELWGSNDIEYPVLYQALNR